MGSANLNFEYDGSTMIGWTSAAAGAYSFATLPGGGAIAGSYTANSIPPITTTWVPLLDQDGSTIGLVNAAQVDSGRATTYTYDPSGNPTVSGTANHWPFQYKGMEKEFTDPAPYYYTGSGQFYSSQLVRSLSEAGQTSSSTGGGPSGKAIAAPSGGGGNGSFGNWYVNNVLDPSSTGNQLGNLPDIGFPSETASYVIPLGEIARIIEEWVSFFEWLLGGNDTPQIPRKLLHGRHPLYGQLLGIQSGLIVTEESAALELQILQAGISEPSSGIAEPSSVTRDSVPSGILLVADQRYGLPNEFWSWYHRRIKKPGDPNLTKKQAEEWYNIWVQEGKPDAEGHRTTNMTPVVPVPFTTNLPPFPIPAPGEGGIFIFEF